MSKIKTPTNEEVIELLQSYGVENKVEVLTAIETQEEGGITLDVDQGFIEMFEVKYPGINIDNVLQTFFENAIENFVEQMKSDPDFAKEVEDYRETTKEDT